MSRRTILLGCLTALAGCASDPGTYAGTLAMEDPKFNSAECQQIRMSALEFDNKIGQRAAIGLASGLLLGPFGIPLAIAADADVDERRRAFNREIHLRCSSAPLPDSLKPQSQKPVAQQAHVGENSE